MDQPIDGSGGGHGIFEDGVPFRKRQVASNQDAAALVAMGQQGKEHFHFLPGVLDIADVVEDQPILFAPAFQQSGQGQFALGQQQFLHHQVTRHKQDLSILVDQFLA